MRLLENDSTALVPPGTSHDDNAARREPRPAPEPASACALSLFDNLNQGGR